MSTSRASGQTDVLRQQLPQNISEICGHYFCGGWTAALHSISTPNFSQRASGMDLDVCGLVGNLKQDQMQLKLNIARPLAHTRCSHQRKESVIARSLFASSCRMRASGLRLEGSVVNGFNVPCGSQSKRVIVYKWGLDRLWLSCLDWSDAAGMVT